METTRLKEIVNSLNYGIKYFRLDFIHGSVFNLVQENFITESEGYDLLDDIMKNRTPYHYKSFLKEDL